MIEKKKVLTLNMKALIIGERTNFFFFVKCLNRKHDVMLTINFHNTK